MKQLLPWMHRMGTIRVATNIFLFDQGTIVENGTHEQLIEMKGHIISCFKNN